MLANRPKKPKTAWEKCQAVIKNVKNWYLLPADKLWLQGNILYQFRSGCQLECRPHSTDINEAVVVLSGIEYPAELCTFANSPDKPIVIFDIGANIGTFGVYIASLNPHRNYQLYAFEPFEGNIALAQANFERNQVANVRMEKKAISGNNGWVNFDTSGAFDAHHINENASHGVKVEAVTLASYCVTYGVDFIDLLKMDIEGSEFAVMATDADFICGHVGCILMEYHLSSDHPTVDVLVNVLQQNFIITLENIHSGGGMLIAVRK